VKSSLVKQHEEETKKMREQLKREKEADIEKMKKQLLEVLSLFFPNGYFCQIK